MASHLVSQHQLSSYATPINGAAGDATVVLGNDNTTVTGYNSHDSDATIHVQDSTAAVFAATPAATQGRKWMTQDAGAVYLYLDTGSAWVEVNYLRNNTATFTVALISTTAIATPSALAATTFEAYASTVSGAVLMGFGTTGDVTLKNRAGTSVLYVGPNTTTVTMVGAVAVGGLITSSAVSGAVHKIVAAANGTYGTAEYLDWYRADGTTQRALIGFNSNNTQTFTFSTHEAGDTFQFLTDNATLALEINSTRIAFQTSLLSTTALATPSALAATQATYFASTVSGAVLMGFGTTNDVALKNRAGTTVLGVGPNTTAVTLAGTLAMGGVLTAGFGIAMGNSAISQLTGITFVGFGGGSGVVDVGIADSGGVGYRLLRVPN